MRGTGTGPHPTGCWGHPRCEGEADGDSVPRGEDGTAIFAMSDQKDVALEIHVTNLPSDPAEPQRDGDDAHEAMLTATFPPELPYSALRPYDGRAPSVRGLGGGKGWSGGCWGQREGVVPGGAGGCRRSWGWWRDRAGAGGVGWG